MEQSDSTITLRRLDISDLDHFMVWATDPRVTRFCSWEPYESREDAARYIENTVLTHPYFRAICIGGRPVGAITVTRNQGNDSVRGEMGYVLAHEYWGRGIATEAARLALREVFEERKGELERVEALVDVENPASQRVLEKAGFEREGVLRKYLKLKGITRDMVIFSDRELESAGLVNGDPKRLTMRHSWGSADGVEDPSLTKLGHRHQAE